MTQTKHPAWDIAKQVKSDGMKCKCDLDNWEPERLTRHSLGFRIQKQAIAKSRGE